MLFRDLRSDDCRRSELKLSPFALDNFHCSISLIFSESVMVIVSASPSLLVFCFLSLRSKSTGLHGLRLCSSSSTASSMVAVHFAHCFCVEHTMIMLPIKA